MKRLKDFKSTTFKNSKVDMANIFNVYNKGDYKALNINKTIVFPNISDIPVSYYTEYTINDDDQWSFIAHDEYGDWRLWWIIAKFNGILDPTQMPAAGTIIKLPSNEVVEYIR
jgi:nucleoid-associated protein YgaU